MKLSVINSNFDIPFVLSINLLKPFKDSENITDELMICSTSFDGSVKMSSLGIDLYGCTDINEGLNVGDDGFKEFLKVIGDVEGNMEGNGENDNEELEGDGKAPGLEGCALELKPELNEGLVEIN